MDESARLRRSSRAKTPVRRFSPDPPSHRQSSGKQQDGQESSEQKKRRRRRTPIPTREPPTRRDSQMRDRSPERPRDFRENGGRAYHGHPSYQVPSRRQSPEPKKRRRRRTPITDREPPTRSGNQMHEHRSWPPRDSREHSGQGYYERPLSQVPSRRQSPEPEQRCRRRSPSPPRQPPTHQWFERPKEFREHGGNAYGGYPPHQEPLRQTYPAILNHCPIDREKEKSKFFLRRRRNPMPPPSNDTFQQSYQTVYNHQSQQEPPRRQSPKPKKRRRRRTPIIDRESSSRSDSQTREQQHPQRDSREYGGKMFYEQPSHQASRRQSPEPKQHHRRRSPNPCRQPSTRRDSQSDRIPRESQENGGMVLKRYRQSRRRSPTSSRHVSKDEGSSTRRSGRQTTPVRRFSPDPLHCRRSRSSSRRLSPVPEPKKPSFEELQKLQQQNSGSPKPPERLPFNGQPMPPRRQRVPPPRPRNVMPNHDLRIYLLKLQLKDKLEQGDANFLSRKARRELRKMAPLSRIFY